MSREPARTERRAPEPPAPAPVERTVSKLPSAPAPIPQRRAASRADAPKRSLARRMLGLPAPAHSQSQPAPAPTPAPAARRGVPAAPLSLSRRQRPAPIAGSHVRTAPPPRSPAAIARAAATGSAGSRLGVATGSHASASGGGHSVVAFPPPADVAARVPITTAPMSIARVGLGDLGGAMPQLPQVPAGGMPALPQIPQAPAMPGMPQMPQLPALPQLPGAGGGSRGGGELATASSSDASPTDQLIRQFKLDREQLGQVIDDLP
ncbi:MAG TPA: hypothetical protein VD836_18640 [Solirubrobacteraceae bacterium]|nr:hypothetical protein [Solirubrobacteraceae bacterium]